MSHIYLSLQNFKQYGAIINYWYYKLFSKNDHNFLRSVKHNDLVLKKKPNTHFFKDLLLFFLLFNYYIEIICYDNKYLTR